MSVADTILEQLGGNRFVVMTGSSHFVSDKNTLRMHLAKNKSRANRLDITLDWDDTYKMVFYKYTAPRFNKKTYQFTNDRTEIIKVYSGVYFDMLQELFTEVTGMYTHL